jgi:purine-binding chemotaxis protein CheW
MDAVTEIRSYLSFKIGNEMFAANVRHVHNIIELVPITKVPHSPSYMLGIINLRGQVLPVVDTRVKFGLSATAATNNTCILVMEVSIENESILVGALVDGVSEVLEIGAENIKSAPSLGAKFKSDFITGVFHNGDSFIMLLDMDKVFSADELLTLMDSVPEQVQ